MANYEPAYQRTAKHEGGFQINAWDKGNYNSLNQLVGTNYGISAPVYEDWIGRPPTVEDMKTITASDAKSIFKKRFWDKIWGDQLPNQAVAEILFDGVVNHGKGVKLAQEVLGVTPDNVFGPKTFNALVAMAPAKFYDAYKQRRKSYYHQLASNNPSQLVFLQGWLKRLNSFNDFGLENTGGGINLASLGLLFGLGLLAMKFR